MAAGIPVVATEKGAEGLGLRHGEDILFARDGNEFVRHISELFDNPDLAIRLCNRARLKVASKFSWDAIVPKFEDELFAAGVTAEQRPLPPDRAGVEPAKVLAWAPRLCRVGIA